MVVKVVMPVVAAEAARAPAMWAVLAAAAGNPAQETCVSSSARPLPSFQTGQSLKASEQGASPVLMSNTPRHSVTESGGGQRRARHRVFIKSAHSRVEDHDAMCECCATWRERLDAPPHINMRAGRAPSG